MTRYTLSLWLCNLYVGYIIQYTGLDKSQAGIKIAGRSINMHRYEDDTTLIAESKEVLKSLLMRRGDEKTSLTSTSKKLFTDSQPSWHPVPPLHDIQMREKWKQWQILFSWAPKPLWTLTEATKLKHTCSFEGIKAMKNVHSVLKSRDSLCYRGLQCQNYGFSGNQIQMCNLDHKKW